MLDESSEKVVSLPITHTGIQEKNEGLQQGVTRVTLAAYEEEVAALLPPRR